MTQQEIDAIYEKGHALLLEDDTCQGKYLYADDLKAMMKNQDKLDFVFMAACHSEFAAKIFLEAGARHVIGVSQETPISDNAVLTFTQTFYSKLWKERSKICTCFETAKLAVEVNHSKVEAANFVLFTATKKRHTCYIYGNFQRGKPIYQKEKPLLWDRSPDTQGIYEQTSLKHDLIS